MFQIIPQPHLLPKLLFVLVVVSSSDGTAVAIDLASIESESPSRLFVFRGGQRIAVALEVHIAGWRVSCDRRHAIVWGQTTRELPVGESPYATVYVVDMASAVARESFTTTRGPFEVEIDEPGALGIVDEYVIELATGKVKLTEAPDQAGFRSESCSDFQGRRPSAR